VDLFWFGIILVILLELAQISPPQGMALYVLHAARREVNTAMPAPGGDSTATGTIGDVYIGVLPFIACMLAVLALLIAFPGIVTWLPDLVKGQR